MQKHFSISSVPLLLLLVARKALGLGFLFPLVGKDQMSGVKSGDDINRWLLRALPEYSTRTD